MTRTRSQARADRVFNEGEHAARECPSTVPKTCLRRGKKEDKKHESLRKSHDTSAKVHLREAVRKMRENRRTATAIKATAMEETTQAALGTQAATSEPADTLAIADVSDGGKPGQSTSPLDPSSLASRPSQREIQVLKDGELIPTPHDEIHYALVSASALLQDVKGCPRPEASVLQNAESIVDRLRNYCRRAEEQRAKESTTCSVGVQTEAGESLDRRTAPVGSTHQQPSKKIRKKAKKAVDRRLLEDGSAASDPGIAALPSGGKVSPCRICNQDGHAAKKCPNKRPKPCFSCGKEGHKKNKCPNVCRLCNRSGHAARTCPDKKPEVCFSCGRQGHRMNDCPNRSLSSVVCYACAKEGHMARNCPNRFAVSTCRICNGKEHLYSDCPGAGAHWEFYREEHLVRDRPAAPSGICRRCHRAGHTTRECDATYCRTCNRDGHLAGECPYRT